MRVKLLDRKCEIKVGYKGSAGYDISVRENAVIDPHSTVLIPSGVCVEIPEGYVGIMKPRSSTFKKGLNVSGVIDSDYRGEVRVMINNTTNSPIGVERYTKPAQLLIVKIDNPSIEYVNQLSETSRGSKGFGSSGD